MSSRCQAALAALSFMLACFAGSACSDDDEGMARYPIGVDARASEDGDGGEDGDPSTIDCERQPDGTACGPVHHCVDGECLPQRCGDGIKAGDEECDDGNEALGDDCTPACRKTPRSCGDGEINDEAEECDDGNRVNDDACANSCTRNECGNDRLDVGEECDDGNVSNDDRCSADCLHIRCRNGRIEPGEECDDGNSVNNDGCTNACIAVRCGDGVVVQGLEECDDGNANDTDTCSNACLNNRCGNNRIDGAEVCDGNALPPGVNGTCKPDCTGTSSLEACEPCRRTDNVCTDYMASGINLLDGCLTAAPQGAGAGWVDRCSALSECITLSQCDLVDDGMDRETVRTCFCGAGVTIADCQSEVVPLAGPCIDEYLAATGCATEAKPIACVINLAGDATLPSGYAQYLAECDRLYCAAECRPR